MGWDKNQGNPYQFYAVAHHLLGNVKAYQKAAFKKHESKRPVPQSSTTEQSILEWTLPEQGFLSEQIFEDAVKALTSSLIIQTQLALHGKIPSNGVVRNAVRGENQRPSLSSLTLSYDSHILSEAFASAGIVGRAYPHLTGMNHSLPINSYRGLEIRADGTVFDHDNNAFVEYNIPEDDVTFDDYFGEIAPQRLALKWLPLI